MVSFIDAELSTRSILFFYSASGEDQLRTTGPVGESLVLMRQFFCCLALLIISPRGGGGREPARPAERSRANPRRTWILDRLVLKPLSRSLASHEFPGLHQHPLSARFGIWWSVSQGKSLLLGEGGGVESCVMVTGVIALLACQLPRVLLLDQGTGYKLT